MFASRIDRAHQYRERAEALRAAAEASCLRESHDILSRLADDYENLAAKIEASEVARQIKVSDEIH